MARPRKVITLEEQLESVNTEIENLENYLAEKKEEQKELEEKIKNSQLEELYAVITNNGKSIIEVKEMLENMAIPV